MKKWPATLTREQFINALDQFIGWMENQHIATIHSFEPNENIGREWVDMMDEIQPCHPESGG